MLSSACEGPYQRVTCRVYTCNTACGQHIVLVVVSVTRIGEYMCTVVELAAVPEKTREAGLSYGLASRAGCFYDQQTSDYYFAVDAFGLYNCIRLPNSDYLVIDGRPFVRKKGNVFVEYLEISQSNFDKEDAFVDPEVTESVEEFL